MYAIPLWIYVNANTPQEAAAIRQKLEAMLDNPIIKVALKQAQIPENGFRVMEPQLVP